MKRKAFSLIEVSVALAIAGIVIAVASTIVVQMNATLKDATIRMRADEEAKLLAEWFIFQVRGIGGDDLRPWEAVAVDNNCAAVGDLPACDGSDRVTVRLVDPDFGSCKLGGLNGVNFEGGVLDSPPLGNGDGILDKNDDTCCFDVFKGQPVGTAPWANRRAMLIGSDRSTHVVSLFNRTSSGGDGCAMNLPGGLPPSIAADTSIVPGGRLIMASEKVFFRSPVTTANLVANGFYEFSDGNGDNLFDPGELTFLTDNVFEFQVGLGYDHDGNGRVVEDGTVTDEWRFNAGGDVLPAAFRDDNLRQLSVGFIVGVPTTSDRPQPSVTLLDGPPRTVPRTHLRGTVTHATLRNVFLFD
jgi:prepilin-type N-terminal cleavage/methylation domain-containing protein